MSTLQLKTKYSYGIPSDCQKHAFVCVSALAVIVGRYVNGGAQPKYLPEMLDGRDEYWRSFWLWLPSGWLVLGDDDGGIGQGRWERKLCHQVLCVQAPLYGVKPTLWNMRMGWEAGRSFSRTCMSLGFPVPAAAATRFSTVSCLYAGTFGGKT